MKRYILALALALGLSVPAFAGEQYLDDTGFAVSGYDVVAYRSLEQSPIGLPQPGAVPGKAGITAEYNGATFAFANEGNRDIFLENPVRYVPQYDGHCAYGVSRGGKRPGNPHLWRIVENKLYLNVTENVVGFWEEDIPGNLEIAEGKWPAIEDKPATDDPVPSFTSEAPVRE